MKLILSRNVALGNGTRDRGTVLATIDCDDSAEVFSGKVKFKPQKGVDKTEVVMALRNPQLCEVDDGKPKQEKDDVNAWKKTDLADMGISKKTVDVLNDAGIKTAGEAFSYGEKNNGFGSVESLTKEMEASVIKGLQSVMPA